MEQEKGTRGLDGCTLKLIAAGAMLCSHIYRVLLAPSRVWAFLDVIGRISFPIFCFLLVEGFCHTKNRGKYLMRLWIAAVLSELPFDMLFYNRLIAPQTQNVLFTMFIGLLSLCGIQWMEKRNRTIRFVPLLIGMVAAWLLKTDYSFWGIWVIGCFYLLRGMRNESMRLQICNMAVSACFFGWIQLGSLIAIPVYSCYNGEKGRSLKYFFYIFYPAHLLLLFFVRNSML